MAIDLRTQISEFVDGGTNPVSFGEIIGRPEGKPALRRERRHRGRWIGPAAAAAGVTVVLVASQFGGQAGPRRDRGPAVVLTAAMVRQVASASRSALATSGEAVISYRTSQAGVLQDYRTDDVTFSGANWNFVIRDTLPASGGQPADTEYAINRVVDGQAYYYIKAQTSQLQWIHDTNPDGAHSLGIPDPRTLLGVLEPGAGFRVCHFKIRHTVKNGHVSVKVVQAPALQGGVTAAVSALRTSVSVSFVHIGQPEVIIAPAHATNVYGHG
jgi:hypothetical protein